MAIAKKEKKNHYIYYNVKLLSKRRKRP